MRKWILWTLGLLAAVAIIGFFPFNKYRAGGGRSVAKLLADARFIPQETTLELRYETKQLRENKYVFEVKGQTDLPDTNLWLTETQVDDIRQVASLLSKADVESKDGMKIWTRFLGRGADVYWIQIGTNNQFLVVRFL